MVQLKNRLYLEALKMIDEFKKHIKKWNLIPDGKPWITSSSKLLPVNYKNKPAILKIAMIQEECTGGQLMAWWNGEGAAPVFVHDDKAFVLERATGIHSLVTMAKHQQDDEATRIICSVIAKLHSQKNKPLPTTLVPLPQWFQSLENASKQYNGIFKQAFVTAQELLHNPQEEVVLHGDIHHKNILDFGIHSWLAIDPKGLFGERYFDYANIFCNPDLEFALQPGRIEKQAAVVAETANLEYFRLIRWILAYAGLSAAWHLEENQHNDAELTLSIAKITLSLF
jgi:streptomycin 6-kinase